MRMRRELRFALWSIADGIGARAPLRSPILLISMPRAGSSWIGSTIGSSEQALYLHEPLTQSYLHRVGRGPSFFEYDACKDKTAYARFASLAYRGIPNFKSRVVRYPHQWSIFNCKNKRVVIKEVNPLALEAIVGSYRPRIIYLLRHPVAVAQSFKEQGWVGNQFRARFTRRSRSDLEKRFSVPYEAGFWEQIGALQAIIQHRVMEALSAQPDHMVVRYEDICREPAKEFSKLFDFCELPMSSDLQRTIGNSSYSGKSATISRRWRSDVGAEDAEHVRKGYFANRPLFYSGALDW